jgi:hypothetical protein
MPCDSPTGPMTDLFGQAVAPAPVSQRPAKVAGLMTLVTSGLIGRDSSASADLQRSLESRLMTRLDTAGSTLFKLTWKGRTTPLGRRYLERAALGRRTSASACTSWPTPQRGDYRSGMAERTESDHAQRMTDWAQLSGWPTPIANDAEKRGYVRGNLGLAGSAVLAGDVSGEAIAPGVPVTVRGRPTPTGEDSQCAGSRAHSMTVNSAANQCAGWGTPTAQPANSTAEKFLDHKRKAVANGSGMGISVTDIAVQASLTASGEGRIGYSARDGIVKIGNGAQLNPEHSRWLQGLPIAFSNCADTAIASLRRSRRNS